MITEEQILADGIFIRHDIQPKEEWMKPVFSGNYVLPRESALKKGHDPCIETQIIQGETRFWGKVGALRIALNTPAQYEVFMTMITDYINF